MLSSYEILVISSSRDEEMSSWNGGNAVQEARDQEFRYGIAKFSQGLQKFRNGSETFAILAKFCYGQVFTMIAKFFYIAKITVHSEIQISAMPAIFAMIAKVTVHSENSNFRYASNFRYIAKFTA